MCFFFLSLLCSVFFSNFLQLAGPNLSDGSVSEGAVHKANSTATVATLRVSLPLLPSRNDFVVLVRGRIDNYKRFVALMFRHLMKLKDFSFPFHRGDNDEEEPPKLKVEHHGISVTGLQSPGKLIC